MAYIPEKHKHLNLLPKSSKNGTEVFLFPMDLTDSIDESLFKLEGTPKDSNNARASLIVPIKKKSYEAYSNEILTLIEKYCDNEVSDLLKLLYWQIKYLNIKENWSVVRYVGHEFDNDEFPPLTYGRCYYWPCSRENPVYSGVIDNDEFSAYLYPCSSESWEIVDDPTGMAQRALQGDADTVSYWKFEEDSPENFEIVDSIGVRPKQMSGGWVPLKYINFDWSKSECDSVTITCPNCNNSTVFMAKTLLNSLDSPKAAEALAGGSMFDFECSSCGFLSDVPHPCLYLDPLHGVCVYLVVSEQMKEGVEANFLNQVQEPKSKGIRFRIVNERKALRDKVVAFNACIDDKELEFLKVGIRGQIKMQGIVPEGNDCEVFLEEVSGDDLIFGVYVGGDRYTVNMELRACEIFEDDIKKLPKKFKQSFYIDENWAHNAMEFLE